MGRDTSRYQAPGSAESLADLVYRPRLAEGNAEVRKASPFLALPATFLGYALLGLMAWPFVRGSKEPPRESSRQVIVDLQDLGEGEAPPIPAAPAPPAGGPPPGAIQRPDAPPPPAMPQTDQVPDKPPAELPAQDLSGVAFPPAPEPGIAGPGDGSGASSAGTGDGTGTGGPGGGPGGGTGQGPRVLDREYSEAAVLRKPVVSSANYPRLAYSARIQGTVKVELLVGTDGVPVSSRALEGPPMLRAAAEATALQYRFKPEIRDGVPVMTRFTVRIVYTIK